MSAETSNLIQFTVGQQLAARSASNYDCIFRFTVVSRTAKFVTLREDTGETRRVGVKVWDGAEWCEPFGRYSMSPILRADREGL